MDSLSLIGMAALWRVGALVGARAAAAAASLMLTPYLVLMLTDRVGLTPLTASVMAGLVFVGGPLLARAIGQAADRRPIDALMIASLVLGCGASLLLGLAERKSSVGLAALACIGLSVAGASFNVLLRTHIGRSFDQTLHPPLFSASSVAFNLGMFAGAALSGLLLQLGAGSSLIPSAAGLYACAAAVVAVAVWHRHDRISIEDVRAAPHSALAPAHIDRSIVWFSLANALLGYLSTTVYLSLAIYASRVLGTASLASVFFSTQSIALVALLPAVGLAIRNSSARRLYTLYFGGLSVAALGFCAFALVPPAAPLVAMLVLAAFFCASQCLAIPSADPLLARIFDKRTLGRVFGTTTSAGAAGSALACLGNGWALSQLPDSALSLIWLIPGAVAGTGFLWLLLGGRRLVLGRSDAKARESSSRADQARLPGGSPPAR